MLIGIDDVLSKLPVQWLDLGLADGRGVHSRDGLWFDDTERGLRLRVGPRGRRLLDAYHRWVSDAVRAGMNVIVDDVVVDRATYDNWCDVLGDLEPTWVAVRCAPEITEARERERGDRPVGMASAQRDIVHADIDYAVQIDTGELSPSDALAVLRQSLDLR
jgi:chloramphenicol 3-O phosphotransferase